MSERLFFGYGGMKKPYRKCLGWNTLDGVGCLCDNCLDRLWERQPPKWPFSKDKMVKGRFRKVYK